MQKTSFKIELVIGEDCSLDSTRKICEEYANKYPDLIKLLPSESNLGMKRNGIRTFEACIGKYIAACEGDDYWTDPLKLQKQVDFLEGNPEYVLCFHNVWVSHKKSKDDYFLNHGLNKDTFDAKDIITREWFIGTGSMVFRNVIHDYPSWFMKVISGDMALHLLLIDKGKFKYIDEVMSVYRKYGDGLSAFYGGDRFMKIALPNRVEMYEAFNSYTQYKYAKLIKNKISHIHEVQRKYVFTKKRHSLLVWIYQKLPFQRIELKRRIKRFLNLNHE